MYDNSQNPDAPYDVKDRLDNLKANADMLYALKDEYIFVLPNHNGAPVAKEYIKQYSELVDAIYAGEAIIEDKLNHFFIEQDPKSAKLCRVRWKNISIFIEKALLMTVYGK